MQEATRGPAVRFQPKLLFPATDEESVRRFLVRDNPENPFSTFVGNDEVITKLLRLSYAALMREDRQLPINLAFLGPAGTGKTLAATTLAAVLELPFASVNPTSVKSNHDLFLEVGAALAAFGVEVGDGQVLSLRLRPQEDGFHYIAPPMVVFIDEVHNLRPQVEQGLLTATDEKTHLLVTEEGFHLDTRNITWIVATTESGKMFHALRTRFSKTQFKNYTAAEVAAIVRANTGYAAEVCEAAGHLCGRVTREAISFAKEVVLEQGMTGSSWSASIEVIRKEHGIDEYGMQRRRLEILKALGTKGTLSLDSLLTVARCQMEELVEEVLPPLLEFTDDQDALVIVSRKGRQITEAGKAELSKRGIAVKAA